MRTFESEPMDRPTAAMTDARDRQKPVAKVRLGRRAHADRGAGVAQQIELVTVGMRGVHDRRAWPEATLPGE